MDNLQLLSTIEKFPIGDIPKSRDELLSKVEIISFLSRFQEQFSIIENPDERENMVKTFLSKIISLDWQEKIPNLTQAERILKLSNGFLHDYEKVEYIRVTNPNFDKTYDIIANNIKSEKNAEIKTR